MSFTHTEKQHFIDLSHLNTDDIHGLLLKAIFFAKNPPIIKKFEGKKVLFYFKEASTRTSLSFQIAAQNLGIEVLKLDEKMSSFTKGEDFGDALKVFEAMGIDGLVMRSSEESILSDYATSSNTSFVNAGAGCLYHPSQALLDLVTINDHFKRTNNLTIAIIGDLVHSRVAHSNIKLHRKLGNKILSYSDDGASVDGCVQSSWEEIQKEADVVMLLRVQKERHKDGAIIENDYLKKHGLNIERFNALKKDSIVMHPGPFNRNVEIDENILDEPQVKILEQVKWGIPTRMAIFDYIFSQHGRRK